MKWNKYGYLAIHEDLPFTVDYSRVICQACTTSDEDGTPVGEIESSGRVPRDSNPTTQTLQLDLLDF